MDYEKQKIIVSLKISISGIPSPEYALDLHVMDKYYRYLIFFRKEFLLSSCWRRLTISIVN